ncbi:MAG: SiaC family regulatory phosphoprotein [Vicingus serpentipes]|nr:SiaC family regulatory phosphoprotein [Vicingus serpentipes]
MKKIEIAGTYSSPKIVIDSSTGIIKICGRSTMIKPQEFYPYVIEYIENYCNQPHTKSLLIIDLEHFNSLSSRYLLMIIELISKIEYKKGHHVKINWYFESDDIGIKENIKLFSKVIQFKINAIEHQYELV